MRDLFDALQLRIDHDHQTHTAHGQITLTELSTGAVDALVRPDVAPVIDIRAIQARSGAGSGAARPGAARRAWGAGCGSGTNGPHRGSKSPLCVDSRRIVGCDS